MSGLYSDIHHARKYIMLGTRKTGTEDNKELPGHFRLMMWPGQKCDDIDKVCWLLGKEDKEFDSI